MGEQNRPIPTEKLPHVLRVIAGDIELGGRSGDALIDNNDLDDTFRVVSWSLTVDAPDKWGRLYS